MTLRTEAAEVLALAKLWHGGVVTGTGDAHRFTRFISSWIAFNALYSLATTSRDGDRAQLAEFARLGRPRALHAQLMAEAPYRDAVESIARKPVRDARSDRTANISDSMDLGQVVLAVYQVRCNLFHGRKSPHSLRDHHVVEAARIIVHALVEHLVYDEDWLVHVA